VEDRRSDSQLVAAARRGDRAAFGSLLDRHERAVRAIARRLLGDEEAEDVAQEAFLQAYLGLDRLRDPARFGSWLCAIAVNLAKMSLRRRGPKLVPLTGFEVADEAFDMPEVSGDVREALEFLPPHEREAVLLYYAGLSSPEAAQLLGERPGTVRVRIHRARTRLRARLGPRAPHRKELVMVEVTVEDVVVRMAKENGDEPLGKRIILLKEKGGERVLPIWVGAPEGDALALGLGGEAMPRPMTADLMAKLLDAAGARVEQVAVNSLRETTFYATVTIAIGEETKHVDARPSDALNLAARVGAPIFVDQQVMEKTAFTGDLDAKLKEEEASLGIEPEGEGEWRSLSPEMVKALHPPHPPKRR
jgi:hypothetical protein